MTDVEELEAAIRRLAERRRWADVERLGALALELAAADRRATAYPDPDDHVALAERDVRDVARRELADEGAEVEVIPSADPLVETLAIGTSPGLVRLVAGCGDARHQHRFARDVGWRRAAPTDYLPMIFITTEAQARALLTALVRAWPAI